MLVLAALSALLYLRYFHPPEATHVGARQEPRITRLSALIDAHINNIFSPLDGQIPPIPHQELRVLREDFADALSKVPLQERFLYQTAIQLCDELLAAIQERERELASLADTRSKAYSVALSQNQKKEEADKRHFFEFNIARRWLENSKSYRDRVIALYARMRQQERQLLAQRTATNN